MYIQNVFKEPRKRTMSGKIIFFCSIHTAYFVLSRNIMREITKSMGGEYMENKWGTSERVTANQRMLFVHTGMRRILWRV
jgi:hypothetical protein